MSERTLHPYGEPRVIGWVAEQSKDYKFGLELGCGLGAYTRAMVCPRRIGLDAFLPYVSGAMNFEENNGIEFILGDMRAFEMFVPDPYDFILFVDTLEHLEKSDAADLLLRCQALANKIAIFVPIGPHEQEPCDGNELQRHLSTWYESDLKDMGFEVVVQTNFHNTNPCEKQAAAFATWVKP